MITLTYTPERPNNPFEVMHRDLIATLADLALPAIDVTPRPGQFEAVGDYVRAVTIAADRWLKSVGLEVAANSTLRIDRTLFDGAFTAAVDDPLGAIDRTAEDISEDVRESGARYCRSRHDFFRVAS
jgi:hypothetical protein